MFEQQPIAADLRLFLKEHPARRALYVRDALVRLTGEIKKHERAVHPRVRARAERYSPKELVSKISDYEERYPARPTRTGVKPQFP